ncbi:MAG: rod shape-determining protein RodA, partial [Planctomycetes bacterium]|nr:rod shape-determining protein RodA [Planctomycetota bacterium]
LFTFPRPAALPMFGLAAAAAPAPGALLVPARRGRGHPFLLHGLAAAGLVVVLFTGRATNSARSWIDLAGGFKLQPSEFMKIGVLLALAKWFAGRKRPRRLEELVVPAALVGLPVALVLAQPDLGTALTFGPLFLAMCWIAGTPWRLLRWVVLVPLALAPIALMAVQDYQRERVEVWLQQDHLSDEQKKAEGYQIWHSKMAVGTGGVSGFGWGKGPENRYDLLPERHNDFIFPVIAEELGLVGAASFLAIYAAIGLLALRGAIRQRDPFTRFVVAGVGVHFLDHLLLNVGVTLGLLPTTGLPLPMVSFGGSAMMASGVAIGLLLVVSADRQPLFGDRAFED